VSLLFSRMALAVPACFDEAEDGADGQEVESVETMGLK
jgi:hypothetical protein